MLLANACFDTVHKIGMPYTRQHALRGEGDGYPSVKRGPLIKFLLQTHLGIIDLKVPLTVKAEPAISVSVGTGMLVSRNSCHNVFLSDEEFFI